jgi:hypothetical protein
MGMTKDQYLRALALDAAVVFAAGPGGIKEAGVFAKTLDSDDVLELADKFADYIQFGGGE